MAHDTGAHRAVTLRVSPRYLWLSLLFLVLGAGACGRRGPIQPPEDVLPQSITNLSARNEKIGVALSWGRPTRYTDGERMSDLGGFIVERATGTSPHVAFVRLRRIALTDQERFRQTKRIHFVDEHTMVGTLYRYRVVSFTTDRYFSAPSNIVTVKRELPGEKEHAPLPATER